MKSEVNIRKIALLSGYSTSTVSKALNDNREISEKTKSKIKEIADFYGYSPNFSARALKSKKTHTIGLVVPNFSKTHYAHLMEGVEEEARKKGYKLMVYQSKNSLSSIGKVASTLFDGSVDGLILITNEQSAPKSEVDYLCQVLEYPLPKVKFDFSNETSTNEPLEHAKERGKEMMMDLADMI